MTQNANTLPLHSTIFLGPKRTAEKAGQKSGLRKEFRKRFENRITEDSLWKNLILITKYT